MELSQKVVLVTGGARRLGRFLVEALSAQGAFVAIHCNRSMDDALTLSNQIGSDRSLVVHADLSIVDDAEGIVEDVFNHFGRLDIVINNASTFHRVRWDQATKADWYGDLNVCLLSPFFIMRRAALFMDRGKIINIADYAAGCPYANYIPYCVSKAALVALTKAMAKVLMGRIQVNAVSPRMIRFPEDQEDRGENCGAVVGVEDVVKVVLELIGDDSSTGMDISI